LGLQRAAFLINTAWRGAFIGWGQIFSAFAYTVGVDKNSFCPEFIVASAILGA
jgi:hypothetical protein